MEQFTAALVLLFSSNVDLPNSPYGHIHRLQILIIVQHRCNCNPNSFGIFCIAYFLIWFACQIAEQSTGFTLDTGIRDTLQYGQQRWHYTVFDGLQSS